MIARQIFLTAVALAFVSLVRAAELPPAITATNPAVSTEVLALRLDPLTKDELASEAAAWQTLLKTKAQEIAETEIAARSGKGNRSRMNHLRDEKSAILDRFDLVLTAYEMKGGDVKEYRKYAAAVNRIKTRITDLVTSWQLFSGWVSSQEGGLKWAIRIFQFFGVMVVFWIIARVISKLVHRTLERQTSISALLRNFMNMMSRRLILFVGLLVALGTIGVNVGAALALIGGGAFVLAFALQDTLSNFANGLMLLVYRPFDVGDSVEIGGILGKVQGVSLVNTTLNTFDNRKVMVPNKKVWGEVITNITGMPNRRVDLKFGIGYNDDATLARQILERILSENERVLKSPASVVRLHELADSSVNFVCRPWVATSDYWNAYWEITERVKTEFDKAGISIPYPQQDVHFHQMASSSPEATENIK